MQRCRTPYLVVGHAPAVQVLVDRIELEGVGGPVGLRGRLHVVVTWTGGDRLQGRLWLNHVQVLAWGVGWAAS